MFEETRLENIIKYRAIQVDEETLPDYIDYSIVLNQEDQEELTGAALVNDIIEKSFFPNGRWDSV